MAHASINFVILAYHAIPEYIVSMISVCHGCSKFRLFVLKSGGLCPLTIGPNLLFIIIIVPGRYDVIFCQNDL